MLHHYFFFYVSLLCCAVFFFFQFHLDSPPLSSISIKFCFIATLLQHEQTVTSHIAAVCSFIWGAIAKRKGMTAEGYLDLNITSAKTCSCLFVWSVQQGHTATKHVYITYTYVYINQKLYIFIHWLQKHAWFLCGKLTILKVSSICMLANWQNV